MKEQASQVEQLFEKKKYKKALLILRKINKKQPSFRTINLTASCYFYDKNKHGNLIPNLYKKSSAIIIIL